jgi:two-component system, response regulator PdtaR
MNNPKILIVEDESIVAKDLKQRLENMGYSVLGTVSNGEDAISKSNEMQPNIILMDIILKGDLDGIETAQIIKKLHDIPFIYLTSYYDDEILERASRTNPYGYLTKPFDDIGLYTSIQMALFKYQREKKLKNNSKLLKFIKKTIEKIKTIKL